eukprot:3108381-Alexandrium_andersonii.AAC.1
MTWEALPDKVSLRAVGRRDGDVEHGLGHLVVGVVLEEHARARRDVVLAGAWREGHAGRLVAG